MKLYHLTLLIVLFKITQSFTQNIDKLSGKAEISIITSGAGESLYEKFGHTAIRVKDSVQNFDDIYNYGIYDFSSKNFYWNFSLGYMKYKLVHYPFYYALRSANDDKRWVKEQVLNLTQDEKTKIFNYLKNNALPKNASYYYDPFFDNCATKPYSIIKKILGNKFTFVDSFSTNKSLRELMNTKIHQNTWGSFGINLALGSKLDKKIDPEGYLYLPDYLYETLENSKVKHNNLLSSISKKSTILLNFKPRISKADKINPLLVFSILSILILGITYKDFKTNKRTKWLDNLLLISTGIVGVAICFLWFFTNHSTAPNNFNILWGFLPNIIVVGMINKFKSSNWASVYFKLSAILLICIPFIWLLEIQKFNYTLIPLVLGLFVRYIYLQKALKC